jgi:hypothetical protein
MRISRQLAALSAAMVIGGLSPVAVWAEEPVTDPAAPTSPSPIAAGAEGGSGTFYVPPTTIVPPLVVTLSAEGGLPSGAPGVLTIRAVDSLGNPTGGFATVIVHFPLAPDNAAYWTDLVLLVPIFEDGYGRAVITIPSAVPSGTPISIEAHAILPPHVAVGELKLNVS